jgi:hypothetical protein
MLCRVISAPKGLVLAPQMPGFTFLLSPSRDLILAPLQYKRDFTGTIFGSIFAFHLWDILQLGLPLNRPSIRPVHLNLTNSKPHLSAIPQVRHEAVIIPGIDSVLWRIDSLGFHPLSAICPV